MIKAKEPISTDGISTPLLCVALVCAVKIRMLAVSVMTLLADEPQDNLKMMYIQVFFFLQAY